MSNVEEWQHLITTISIAFCWQSQRRYVTAMKDHCISPSIRAQAVLEERFEHSLFVYHPHLLLSAEHHFWCNCLFCIPPTHCATHFCSNCKWARIVHWQANYFCLLSQCTTDSRTAYFPFRRKFHTELKGGFWCSAYINVPAIRCCFFISGCISWERIWLSCLEKFLRTNSFPRTPTSLIKWVEEQMPINVSFGHY